MKIKDLFDIEYGVNLELINCVPATYPDGINFVARTSENNGVVARVQVIDGIKPQPAGTISCAGGGSVLSSFVQKEPYYSGRDLYVLTPKREMDFAEKLYYCHLIKMNKYRYNYGRQANRTLGDIELPDNIPSWIGSINIQTLEKELISQISSVPLDFSIANWKEFAIGGDNGLFDVLGTKTTPIEELYEYMSGSYPYVTTRAINNGIAGYFNYYTEEGNVLTIDSAVLGFCTYQENNFSASDHVEKLVPHFHLNKYIALFLTTIINKETYKYSYGRKCNQEKIRATKIKLPTTASGFPDWQFMEEYIKQLPYSDKL